jgi:hypothetical protein
MDVYRRFNRYAFAFIGLIVAGLIGTLAYDPLFAQAELSDKTVSVDGLMWKHTIPLDRVSSVEQISVAESDWYLDLHKQMGYDVWNDRIGWFTGRDGEKLFVLVRSPGDLLLISQDHGPGMLVSLTDETRPLLTVAASR